MSFTKFPFIVASVCVLLSACGSIESVSSSVTIQPSPALPSASPSTSPEIVSINPKFIPGVESADIKLSLEKYVKMEFNSGPTVDSGKVTDPDTQVDITCDIRGDLPSHIASITVSAVGTSESSVINTASYYFGFVASVPYDGSTPADAKKWTVDNVKLVKEAGDVKTTEIGGVMYEISGTPFAKFMTISIAGEKVDNEEITAEEAEALKKLEQ